jgi:hypothetical protein
MAPPAVTVKRVLISGVSGDGAGVHVDGGAVAPAVQLKVTVLEYPFRADAVPLKVAF